MEWIVQIRQEKGSSEFLTGPIQVEAEDRWNAVVAAITGLGWEKLAGMQEWSDLASVRRVEPKMIREFRKVK